MSRKIIPAQNLTVCDRCGKEDYADDFYYKIGLTDPTIKDEDEDYNDNEFNEYMDLCRDCGDYLRRWFKREV